MYAYFPILKERSHQLADPQRREQQMLAIGRGLMSGPGCSCSTNPPSAFADHGPEVGRMITEIHGQGMTILLVSRMQRWPFRFQIGATPGDRLDHHAGTGIPSHLQREGEKAYLGL